MPTEQQLTDLIRQLTNINETGTPQPHNQDEQGGCIWCAGMPPRSRYGYATHQERDHMKDCPWVKTKRLLRPDLNEKHNGV